MGDDLVALVAGQGYKASAPVVSGVSDPVNGQWSAVANYKTLSLDGTHFLSYAVYEFANSAAAPNGFTVTIAENPGQSSASAILLDVRGFRPDGVWVNPGLTSSSSGALTSPTSSVASGELAVGLFGAYEYGQSLSVGSGWTADGVDANCTAALAESQVAGASGSLTASSSAGEWTDYVGGLVTFAPANGKPVAGSTLPPSNTALPVVSGTAQQGDVLSTSNGSWSGSPTAFGYQWQRCASSCANISGATGSSYTLTASDVGDTVRSVVTATNAGGSTPASSAQTAVVTAAATSPPSNTVLPVVSGTAVQGDVLTTSNGSWSGSPTSYGYQWQRCSSSCANISGATSSSYTLQAADVGDTIDVVVTATNAGGSTPATSAQTGTVSSGGGPSSSMVSMGYYVGWEANDVASLPWNDLTQLDLFSVMPCSPDAGSGGDTTYPAGGCTADETRIDVSQHGMAGVNVPSWVSTVHAHGKQAFIVIGGTPGSYAAGGVVDWYYPCQNSTSAASFATNLVNYARVNGFDGIDLDEEQDANTAGNGGTPVFTTAMFDSCLQYLHNDIAATTTTQGHTMQFTGYLDPPIDWDLGTDMMTACGGPCVEWFDSGGYGDTCASNCASFANDVSKEETHEGIPANMIVLGLATQDVSGAQTANANLATTNATESGTISSISVSPLSTTIPAGKIVLASTENPPAHYQILQTSGASSGATSIPITGSCTNATTCTSGPAQLTTSYASGSNIQNDYRGMYDCGNAAGYAATQGLKGVMVWTIQSDAADYNGTFACFNQIAPNLTP